MSLSNHVLVLDKAYDDSGTASVFKGTHFLEHCQSLATVLFVTLLSSYWFCPIIVDFAVMFLAFPTVPSIFLAFHFSCFFEQPKVSERHH